MSSIYDFPKVASPYPEISPWYDLSSLVVNGWASDPRSFPFMAKIEANEISIYLRTRYGTDRFIVNELPQELVPSGDRVFNAFAASDTDAFACLIRQDGRLQIMAASGNYSTVTDGSLLNFVAEVTYLRRAL